MEYDFLRWLKQRYSTDRAPVVGVGDDAAVFASRGDHDLVLATDALLEGVHFRLSDHAPEAIGHKALAVNLSDLAAMAARPFAATVALALPRPAAAETGRRITDGIQALADTFEVSVCGGDTNVWDQGLVISVTVIGDVPAGKAWRRDGARPGHCLVATGSFGGSLAGRHLGFTPRVAEALRWRDNYGVAAATDVSDGLALDAANLAEASGCGVVLELEQIPISPDAGPPVEPQALTRALNDGEDFELLLAMEPAEAERLIRDERGRTPLRIVGRFEADAGLWQQDGKGDRQPLTAGGYQHQ